MIKVDLNTDLKKHSLSGGSATLLAVGTIAGYIWIDLQPRVEASSKETATEVAREVARTEVDKMLVAGDFATGKDVKALNRNFEQAEQRIRDLERKQDRNNAKAEAERKSIKEKIDDTNQLIRDVLRMRRERDGR